MESWTRGYLGAFLDRSLSWAWSLSTEKCGYRCDTVRVPVGDGISRIELLASLYIPLLPDGIKPEGTILSICPYGRGVPITLQARLFASRGYHVLFVCCRGTFGSGGVFDPFRSEIEDSQRVVEWMREQDWYTGSFATIGQSYLGFTQWALLCDPPRDMDAAVISVGPHDFGRKWWQTGALGLEITTWANGVSLKEDNLFKLLIKSIGSSRRLQVALTKIPLWQSVEQHFNGAEPWLQDMITNSDLGDPYYAPMNAERALEETDVPILLTSGWYDIFMEQTMEQYFRLHERGIDVALTMGPWDHNGTGFSAASNQQTFQWIEHHHSKVTEESRKQAIHYYVTGIDEWRYIDQFPPQTLQRTLYLRDGNLLSTSDPSTPSSKSTSSCSFVYEPRNPTPTIGGNLLQNGGRVNDSALSLRSDVLTFTTEPLEEDIEIVGQASVELCHSTDRPHADLFIRISEVDDKGRSFNVTETYKRLDEDRASDAVSLKFNHCAHRFQDGKRIRLMVAGGSFLQFARNQGVLNEDNRASKMENVRHTIELGSGISRVFLPVSMQ